jgi:uncharacterized small protein (DUF1192 family)
MKRLSIFLLPLLFLAVLTGPAACAQEKPQVAKPAAEATPQAQPQPVPQAAGPETSETLKVKAEVAKKSNLELLTDVSKLSDMAGQLRNEIQRQEADVDQRQKALQELKQRFNQVVQLLGILGSEAQKREASGKPKS